MRKSALALATLLAVSGMCCPAPAQTGSPEDPWAPFQFLIGDWSGAGSVRPGEAVSGVTSFSFDLGKTILIRRNRAEIAPNPGEPRGAVHEDLMIIYREPGGGPLFRSIYFDSEGHVINYSVSFPAKGRSVVFESAASEKAPRFRFIYEMGPDGLLSGEFDIAPPGGEYKTYTKGLQKKVT
jgi:hypothetical protein